MLFAFCPRGHACAICISFPVTTTKPSGMIDEPLDRACDTPLTVLRMWLTECNDNII
jgi:hypothetical protein